MFPPSSQKKNLWQVVFKTDIYGTFRQSIVFDFGVEAILMREVQVESAPAADPEKIRKEITLSEAQRWNERTVTLVNFEPRLACGLYFVFLI